MTLGFLSLDRGAEGRVWVGCLGMEGFDGGDVYYVYLYL